MTATPPMNAYFPRGDYRVFDPEHSPHVDRLTAVGQPVITRRAIGFMQVERLAPDARDPDMVSCLFFPYFGNGRYADLAIIVQMGVPEISFSPYPAIGTIDLRTFFDIDDLYFMNTFMPSGLYDPNRPIVMTERSPLREMIRSTVWEDGEADVGDILPYTSNASLKQMFKTVENRSAGREQWRAFRSFIRMRELSTGNAGRARVGHVSDCSGQNPISYLRAQISDPRYRERAQEHANTVGGSVYLLIEEQIASMQELMERLLRDTPAQAYLPSRHCEAAPDPGRP